MKLILKDDVENLGFKDDVVKVKNGYGRNFLIPNGLAMLATESNKKVLAEKIKQSQNKQKHPRLDHCQEGFGRKTVVPRVDLCRNCLIYTSPSPRA